MEFKEEDGSVWPMRRALNPCADHMRLSPHWRAHPRRGPCRQLVLLCAPIPLLLCACYPWGWWRLRGYACMGMCVQVSVHGCVCMGVCMQVCMHGCACMAMCVQMCVHEYTCAGVHAWMCMHDSRSPFTPTFLFRWTSLAWAYPQEIIT